ncbi:patatin-like phospholipase family protein [Aureivirga marina]|uniref:patatin-like phospholipase family protein n=1 Tax=Aureivirga marina TaxID=1182451 RepID=UPI0018CAD47A|nr:patatin-like phospholipase family protein [Aureivirga marina]
MRKIRILSIDGGGIRGILPGVIIQRLENILQEVGEDPNIRISDMFDFFAGTSTGGILTLTYLMPDSNGRPKFTAEQAVNLYLDRGDEIFDASLLQKIKSLNGISDEKYDASELEEALHDNFGDTRFHELLKPCIISSYDIRKGKPHFFKQHKAENDIFNFKVKDIARATSAAPTYFETARIKNGIGTPFPLIDGGMFANNPALVAYSEARNMKFSFEDNPTAKHMMIVSIGTGSSSKTYEYKKAKDWGLAGWVKPIIDIMMSGSSQTVNYHLKQIFKTIEGEGKYDYHRLEPQIALAEPDMDDASIKNMTKLKEDALSYVADERVNQELYAIAAKLLKYNKESVDAKKINIENRND